MTYKAPQGLNLHDQHLLIHQQYVGAMRVDAELERRQHVEERDIPWWRLLLPRFIRFLLVVHSFLSRPLYWLADKYLLDEQGNEVRTWEEVTVYDETVDEHEARLRELAKRGLNSIPVHTSPLVPEGTAYLFNPDAIKFVPEGGYKFEGPPNWASSLSGLTFPTMLPPQPPSVASVMLVDQPDDETNNE